MKTDVSFLLENAAWPAFVVEAAGTIRLANQAAIAFFGPKLEGESLSLSAIWAESTETAEQFIARWERSATPVVSMAFRAKGGAVVPFATHICPTRESQRRYVFQLIAETALTLAAAAPGLEGLGVTSTLPAPNASDTVFLHKQKLDCALHLARTVALDFNNALTGIMAHTSLLLSQADRAHPWRGALIEVEKAAQRAAEITHQLSSFSRPEKEGDGRQAGNLNTLLRRVVEIFQQTRAGHVSWSLQFEPQLYSAKYDEAKLQQVFIKIIENSLEAMSEAGRIAVYSSNVEVAETRQDGTALLNPGSYVCMEIIDSGPGIDASILSRIFEPFFSTKNGHRGLGLAWVYGIVTNHRGAVAISSGPGQGTGARVYLPATQRLIADTGSGPEDLRGTQSILMVDDEDLLLTMGKVVLGSFGYRVYTANTGALALQTLEEMPEVDLVITDLVMPQMSGRELIEQIQLRLPGVPVLCTSGFARAGEAAQETFLAKPFTSQELLIRVRQILGATERSP